MKITPTNSLVGAYVEDVDLSTPIESDAIDELVSAWHKWGVLFLRNQNLNDEQQVAAASIFGDPVPYDFAPTTEGSEIVHKIDNEDGKPKGGSSNWHTDATWLKEPPRGSMLQAIKLPSSGGDTLFASMSAAFDSLSPATQNFVDGLTALHHGGSTLNAANRIAKKVPEDAVSHPVVRTHPVTGRKCIFVNRLFTQGINELNAQENEALLPMLCDLTLRPELQFRFNWEEGDIAVWDNRSVQHYATADYSEARVMHRVVLAGDPVE